jgi:hypothetical protein
MIRPGDWHGAKSATGVLLQRFLCYLKCLHASFGQNHNLKIAPILVFPGILHNNIHGLVK